MAISVPRLVGFWLVVLLSATLGRADALEGRSPTTLHFYTPTPSYTIPSWYTGTSSASQPTASVSFAFGNIPDMSVCGQSNITWSITGDTYYMMGIAATPVSSNDSPTIITIMDGGLGMGYYTWSPVNVAAGEYELEVSIPNVGMLYYSDTFYVRESSDHSCLSLSTSLSASSDPPNTAGTATSTSAASGSSSSAADSSGVPAVGATNNSSGISSGGIAGIVIGAVIFVGALIAILILLRRCRQSRAMGAPRGSLFEKRRPKGAVSIGSRSGSFSSTRDLPAQGLGNSAFGMAPHYNLNGPSRSDFAHGISDEDVRSPSITGEKPLTHAPVELGMAPPAVVHRSPHAYRDSLGSLGSGSTTVGSPVAATNYYRPSRYSSLQYTSDPFSSSPPTPSPRPSVDYQSPSQVPIALFSPSSVESTPRAYGSPGVPRDISIASSSSPDLAYDPDVATSTGVVVAAALPRRAPPAPPGVPSSSTSSGVRRTKSASARKPVPVYEPSISGEALELVEPSTPHSTTGTATSYYNTSAGQHSKVSLGQTSSAGNDWSSAAAHSHSPASGSSGSYLPHASRNSLPGLGTRGDMPELNHKSSFGDRQMHVLVPDPPLREML